MKFSRSEFKLLVSSRIEESEDDRVASSANRSNIQNCNVTASHSHTEETVRDLELILVGHQHLVPLV